MSQPDKIIGIGPNAYTLMMLMRGELKNYGYETTEPHFEYEPTWGEAQLTMEVKQGG